MLICESPPFIFLAVPKTGTSSVERALQAYNSPTLSAPFNKHVLALKLEEDLDPMIWSGSFKFAFVREPVAWMYSWYRYRQRKELSDPKHRFHRRYTGNKSFDEFIETFAEDEIFLKQSDFLRSHTGELLVDYVGKYESLQHDFDEVCQRIGISPAQLPRINTTSDRDAQAATLSPSSLKIIERYFLRDFELLGYS
jgi:hypothetical protein